MTGWSLSGTGAKFSCCLVMFLLKVPYVIITFVTEGFVYKSVLNNRLTNIFNVKVFKVYLWIFVSQSRQNYHTDLNEI